MNTVVSATVLLMMSQNLHLAAAFTVQRRSSTLHSRFLMKYDIEVDVAVIGGGIAGSTISYLLQEQQKLSVALVDPRANGEGTWYPNYGEWRDEWHCLSDRLKLPELKECTTNEWEVTDCFFGGSYDIPMDQRLTLPRCKLIASILHITYLNLFLKLSPYHHTTLSAQTIRTSRPHKNAKTLTWKVTTCTE